MATTRDRPKRRGPATTQPGSEAPLWAEARVRPRRPNRSRDRRRAYLQLFGPALVLLLGALALGAVVLALALSSGETPPATGAAQLVPGNALLYLHISTDPSRPAVGRALALSRRLPGAAGLFAGVMSRVDASLGSAAAPISFETDVRPWLGKEAALAVLDTPGASADSLIVLDVRRPVAARRFLITTGAQPDGAFRGVPLYTRSGGTSLAFVRHYLVLGQAASVRAAVDVADGQRQSLNGARAYRDAGAGEPDDRVLDAYLSAAGVQRLLLPRGGLLGALGQLIFQPALTATTISLSPAAGGA
ncbi:MAG: DUF3352 domain-containing protein, partial [Solirubrobacterales bacterium]|nr:DUF3352 domain-containing protein [Solirubrobacterales bacterium]